jgi:hydrogenase nickel incorporation protein HypB
MKKIEVEQKVLAKNDDWARANRERLRAGGIFSFNMISSPGSGKTSLLERTLAALRGELPLAVIEGDIQTDNDAARLRGFGFPVVQINTGGLCHLDASMISRTLDGLDLDALRLLIVENVGNLVCPSSYDLGEDEKVVLISTTEGDDKPLKYPAIFRRATVMIVNKTDLVPYTDFSLERVRANALGINPDLTVFELSCRTGQGLDAWLDWIRSRVAPPPAR